jgi:hypothetical protein
MAYMNLDENPSLFIALNKDTSEIFHELIPFDSEAAQRYSDRAVQIIRAGENNEKMPCISNDSSARNQKKTLVVPMNLMMNTLRFLAAELSLRGLQLPCSMQCMRLLREYLNSHYPKKHLVIDHRFLWNHAFFVSTKNDVLIPEDLAQFSIKNAIDSDDEIVEKLKSFISKNRSFFQDLSSNGKRPFLQILGYKSSRKGKVFYYVPRNIFESEITNDVDEIYKLIEKGLLIPNTNISACHVVSINKKTGKVYIVRNLK